ncbi:MAG: RNA-binding transcriptional accessory protein [Fibrobacter sp.]|nr:RNA-binding transcriptional accessory protein [Fibrobacter sp.]
MNITEQLIKDFEFKPFQVENTLALFDEGATVPFIARYRKEKTGSLDEIQVRDLLHKYTYYKELDERRTTILESIKSQGKLTPELEKKINETLSKTELEDLYLPYKPKRSTRATKAKDAGLEPLARWLAELEDPACDLLLKAAEFLNPEKEIDSPQKALQGACDILAEELSDDAETRKWMRELAFEQGLLVSEVKKEFEGQKTKFEMYYNFKEKVSTLPSHRVLAMLRGEREKVLRLYLELQESAAINYLNSKLIRFPESAAVETLKNVVIDSLNRLLLPATETEVRKEIRERAEAEAIKVFGENLEALLLSAPAGRKAVIGVDPGFRTGCKLAVVDDTGKFIEHSNIYPHEPQNKKEEARAIVLAYIQKYDIRLIAIGNGTASRETDEFVREVLKDVPPEKRPVSVVVNESGASVYSASDVAIHEFPDLDLTVRGAISIARRLQDPLSELVKIDPKSIGVGQYQHDVNQSRLKESLDEVVESCVNRVGVDVNLASEELLKYVSGLNRLIAANIVNYRNQQGAFPSRDTLLKVPGLGEKKFQLSAGFLRIPGGKNPLDNSAVHPERYELVKKMASEMNTTLDAIVGNAELVRSIDKKKFISEDVGLPTIEDIISELEKPGRDPREEFKYARFSESVMEIKDLKEGMMLEGTVTNVTNFGAFVDIGVHQDGLVHISELADRFVDDPKKVVRVGQVVKVRVMKVDPELKRISLSMKTGEPGAHIPAGKKEQKRPAPKSGTDALKEKFGKGRDESGKLKTYKPKFNIRQIMK